VSAEFLRYHGEVRPHLKGILDPGSSATRRASRRRWRRGRPEKGSSSSSLPRLSASLLRAMVTRPIPSCRRSISSSTLRRPPSAWLRAPSATGRRGAGSAMSGSGWPTSCPTCGAARRSKPSSAPPTACACAWAA
jgi:hypothetical protein